MVDMGFVDIIRKIADERGKDIFLEPKKLKALLSDYIKNEYKKESLLLFRILEADIVKIINTAEDIAYCRQGLVKRLEDDYGFSPSKSGEMLDLLFHVLRGNELQTAVARNTALQPTEKIKTKTEGFSKLRLIHAIYAKDSTLSVAFSSDSKYIVSGSWDKTIKLWDAKNRQLIRTYKGHKETIVSVAFSPNDKYIVSGSWDKTIKLWDTENGQLIRTYKGHKDMLVSVAFSPDGKYIVSGSVGTLKLWDVENGLLIRTYEEGHEYSIPSVAFSPDGKYIVSGSESTLKLWDVENGLLIRTYEEGHECSGISVAFSPDGKYMVSGLEKTLKLWDAENGLLICTYDGHEDEVVSVAFSPDGKYIVSGSADGMLKFWHLE